MKKIFIILFILLASKLSAQSYELVIQMNDNSEVSWNSESLRNIYFDGETTLIVVESEDLLTHSYELADIKKIYFTSGNAITEFNNDNKFFVYPNPAKDNIRIIGVENQDIEIFSMDGKSMFEGEYKTSLNISDFPEGTYIIKTDCQTLKFIKL